MKNASPVPTSHRTLAPFFVAVLCLASLQPTAALAAPSHAPGEVRSQLVGPAGSGAFGAQVNVLPNGNIVVVDPSFDADIVTLPVTDTGAVYLYDGATLELISVLRGSSAGDAVGSNGITVLSNGNFVVNSPGWDNRDAIDAGAVTWVNGSSGLSGTVSVRNSLVGVTLRDAVGNGGVTALNNGNYVVVSPDWDNAARANVGAATWGSGVSGINGVVSATNSLIGSAINDAVGRGGAIALSNGNYVVSSWRWANDNIPAAGAVTWCNGATGLSGRVSTANSLVGVSPGDFVGQAVIALTNGHYAVGSPFWNNGATTDAGAATWGDGATGTVGVVSAANSMIGDATSNEVGTALTALTNGNFVIASPNWDAAGSADVGAATWVAGSASSAGEVTPVNSLIGSTPGDRVGFSGVTALTNGNFVVASPHWNNRGVLQAGAQTWGNGASGSVGTVSAANSLVGTVLGDFVGEWRATALGDGSYAVSVPRWDNGVFTDTGAVLVGNGVSGTIGSINPATSLIGRVAGDSVGHDGVVALPTGGFVVRSGRWSNGAQSRVGAATFISGAAGLPAVVSAANSLIGSANDDRVSQSDVIALSTSSFVVLSHLWDADVLASNAGAVTWISGVLPPSGVVGPNNSIVGQFQDAKLGARAAAIAFDPVRSRLAVGSPKSNRVILLRRSNRDGLPGDYTVPGVLQARFGSTDFAAFSELMLGLEDPRIATLSNIGDGSLNITDITLDSPAFSISGPHSVTLNSGTSVSLTLRFKPIAIGPVTGTLTISTFNAGAPVHRYVVSGAGIKRAGARVYLPLSRRAP